MQRDQTSICWTEFCLHMASCFIQILSALLLEAITPHTPTHTHTCLISHTSLLHSLPPPVIAGLNSAVTSTSSALELQAHKISALGHRLQSTNTEVVGLQEALWGAGGSAAAAALDNVGAVLGGGGGGGGMQVGEQ